MAEYISREEAIKELREVYENEYPVVVYCNIDNSADRFGNFDIRIFDYIPMKNLAVNGLR